MRAAGNCGKSMFAKGEMDRVGGRNKSNSGASEGLLQAQDLGKVGWLRPPSAAARSTGICRDQERWEFRSWAWDTGLLPPKPSIKFQVPLDKNSKFPSQSTKDLQVPSASRGAVGHSGIFAFRCSSRGMSLSCRWQRGNAPRITMERDSQTC